jgi:hypothetical protein
MEGFGYEGLAGGKGVCLCSSVVSRIGGREGKGGEGREPEP